MYCRDWEGDNGQERSKKGGKWVEDIFKYNGPIFFLFSFLNLFN